MMHIIIGLFAIALGIWGVFDEWYYVVDAVKGGSSLLLILVGMVGILAGVAPQGLLPEQAGAPGGATPEIEREGDE